MALSGADLRRLRQELVDWVARPANEEILKRGGRRRIEEHLPRLPDQKSVGQVSVGMFQLAEWEAALGALAVLDGDAGGWSSLGHALDWRLWQLRLLLRLYSEDRRRRKHSSAQALDAALCLCHALALRRAADAEWCGQRLSSGRVDGSLDAWDSVTFEPFVLKLYALLCGKRELRDSIADDDLGVYGGIFQTWEDTTHLGPALEGACAYHAARIDDPDDVEFLEFDAQPYPVFPVEILAIQRVRSELGLEMPDIEHPLIRGNPLAEVPIVLETAEDVFLLEVARQLRRAYPGLDDSPDS